MGRLEALTALALGRGHYEDEVIYNDEAESSSAGQQYNERGHPRNPETKRREREHVRAANEVMQVTGVVEDSLLARAKAHENSHIKTQETFAGLRLMELGRIVLIGGLWGVLGLRRRILLYKSYTDISMFQILRQEASTYSIPTLLFAGAPTLLAYHVMDWAEFFIESSFENQENVRPCDENELINGPPEDKSWKATIMKTNEILFYYINLHFRRHAILQQLNLIPSTQLFPSFWSFVPFTAASHLVMPPIPAANISSMTSCGLALLRTMAPMLIILAHGKVKIWASKLLYRPLYKILPRPTGESVFRGLPILPPSLEYDAPDNPQPPGAVGFRSEDEPTLRALEGLPTINRTESRPQQSEQNEDSSSEEEDDEIAHATLISFDVEATESAENPLGAWSAELRSANEPKPSGDTKYRVTGLTMLPVFTLTEGLRDIAATIIDMPLEAVMIRLIGRAYRLGAGLPTADLYPVGPRLRGFGNLLGVLTMQVAATGIVWAGFTLVTQTWASNVRRKRAERAENEASSRS